MALSKSDEKKILRVVKKEPCLIQDVAHTIQKSWITAERYVEKIEKESGLIRTKTFRKGTQGAIKLVYWNYSESTQIDEIQKKLFNVILSQSNKKYFDPLEIFQYVDKKKGNAFYEHYKDADVSLKQNLIKLLRSTENELYIFSGNLSFINMVEKGVKVIDVFEELLKRDVNIRILMRVDFASLENIGVIDKLIKKYPNLEIRHTFQPLRGFLVDDKMFRLKDEKEKLSFKKKELVENIRVFYDIADTEWVDWLKNVFWYVYRNSLSYVERKNVLERIMV